ncbi:MAG: YggS family pyridoxal phosphate-dependent enzyme [Gammaproteobacteria bacterium]|nr:MAG: YggS family pyridoxal phosphate-dependent enzyme [Gammaproteobacteria bacterium]
MVNIASNIEQTRQKMAAYARKYHRAPESLSLLAVSKTHGTELIRDAYACGQQDFGESYLQEAVDKIHQLQDLDIRWHFIGAIQSNKTRDIARLFDWVHSVDRLKIAQRLSAQRPAGLPALNICLQINISQEASKAGMSVQDLPNIAAQVVTLPGIRLRGLMAIPQESDDFAEQRRAFRQLHDALLSLNTQGFNLDTLSMGMSDDMEAAIAEGATILRIGTAIFGYRPRKLSGMM